MVSSWVIKNVNIYLLFNVHTKQVKAAHVAESPPLWKPWKSYRNLMMLPSYCSSQILS